MIIVCYHDHRLNNRIRRLLTLNDSKMLCLIFYSVLFVDNIIVGRIMEMLDVSFQAKI